jgi:TolB-like protein
MPSAPHRCICLLALLLAILLGGCYAHHARTQTIMGYQALHLTKVAVMPFLAGRDDFSADDLAKADLDCTLAAFCQTTNELATGAEDVLTRETQAALARKLGGRVLPLAESSASYDRMPKDFSRDSPRQLAMRFGRRMGADHVILGSVWRFRERAEDQGASVGFTVFLVEVDNGRRVWRGRFDKTQQALLEDLRDARGFFRQGQGWLSATELARYGIEEVIASFPQVME